MPYIVHISASDSNLQLESDDSFKEAEVFQIEESNTQSETATIYRNNVAAETGQGVEVVCVTIERHISASDSNTQTEMTGTTRDSRTGTPPRPSLSGSWAPQHHTYRIAQHDSNTGTETLIVEKNGILVTPERCV